MSNKRPKNAEAGEFKPGMSGNLKGRPKFDPQEHLENLPKVSDSYVRKVISKLCQTSRAELEAIVSQNSGPAIEQMIGKIILEAIEFGDHKRLDFILERLIGKVTIQTEISYPKPTIIKLIGQDAALVLGSEEPGDVES